MPFSEREIRSISEYDIQDYVAERFHKLGISRISGPFPIGPDFAGEAGGFETMIEVEKECSDYLRHNHHKDPQFNEVGILIVMSRSTPRGLLRSLLPPRIIPIDQTDFGEWADDREKARARKEAIFYKHFAGVEVRMENDGKVIFSSRDIGENIDFEDIEYASLADYFSLVASKQRLRVIQALSNAVELRFSDILKITGNPKLVGDCVNPMIERKMLIHSEGQGYRLSARGRNFANIMLVPFPMIVKHLVRMEREALAEYEEGEGLG